MRKGETKPVENLVTKPLTEFKPGDTIYVARKLGGFQYVIFGKFVKFERGFVVATGQIIRPEWADARTFGGQHHDSEVTFNGRPKACYLWGQGPGDGFPRCHWFKDANHPPT